jgi:hypothetical protein
MGMDSVYRHEERSGDAGKYPSCRLRNEIDPFGINSHQLGAVKILGCGPNRNTHIRSI